MRRSYMMVVLFIAFFIILLGACSSSGGTGGGTDNTGGTAASEDQTNQVEIRISWWGGEGRHNMQNELMDKFEEEHPHITVKREFTSWAGYWDRLATQTSGGNAPDVITMHPVSLSDYAKRGALYNLDGLVEQGLINLEDFNQSTIDSGKYDGSIYMVTIGNSIPGVFYNKRIFDELNVEYPDMNWTWEEFMVKAIEVQRAIDAAGWEDTWALQAIGYGGFEFFLRQRGKNKFTEDGQLGFEKQDMIDFLEMEVRLREAGAVPDAGTKVEFTGLEHERSLFGNERTAILFQNSNQLQIYQDLMESELDIVRIPITEGGENGEYITGAYLSIGANTEHPEEAAQLVNWWVNSESATEIYKTEHGPLGSSKMNSYVKQFLGSADQKVLDYVEEVSQYARPVPDEPLGAIEVRNFYDLAVEEIDFGVKTVEQAVDDFFNEAQKVLE